MEWIAIVIIAVAFAPTALLVLRIKDALDEQKEWKRLRASQTRPPSVYGPEIVAGIPEVAQRYFNFAIMRGTPLWPVAEIEMEGEFSLGTREKPNYREMKARQILAAPFGFVWKLRIPGAVPISGSDSGSWTRFRILNLIPVARISGDRDHARSAYGRLVAEAAFWTPAALLPRPGVRWEAAGPHEARVTVTQNGMEQTVQIKVGGDGMPTEVHFLRWSDANPEKRYRWQPFGGRLSDFREVEGFRVPFGVEAGNLYGTDDYFSFFKARVVAVRFAPEIPQGAKPGGEAGLKMQGNSGEEGIAPKRPVDGLEVSEGESAQHKEGNRHECVE